MSGDRFNDGKAALSMVPLAGMEAHARAAMFGAGKYDRDNWRKGLNKNELIDSLLRHLMAIADPDENPEDAESALHHIDHVVWNANTLAHAIKHNWE